MTQQNLQPITRELIGALRQTGAQVQENEPMSLHTSFQIGGPADVFATVSDERSLRGVLKLCKEAGAPVYVIGNGSDLLIPDQGLRSSSASAETCAGFGWRMKQPSSAAPAQLWRSSVNSPWKIP